MYRRFVGALYVINIVAQCIFTLLTAPAFLFFITYLLIRYINFPLWSYAISLPIGFIIGIVSMIRFAITSSEALERLEKQNQKNKKD